MPIVSTKNPSGLKIKFDCGKDDKGKTIVKTKTYSNVKASALDEAVYEVGSTLASLQEHNLMEICKIDNTTISE